MMYFEMDCPCKGKNLDKLMQPAILEILYGQDLHGFMLIQKLGESPMFGGITPDRAGVYRYLKKMETSGLLASDWEMDGEGGKPRRIYSITEKGRQCLANWSEALKQYLYSVSSLIGEIDTALKT